MLIGIDDTDSLKGMCTTYIAKKICGGMQTEGYPRLVRLNPNIPYKTRGNGAIALKTSENDGKVKQIVLDAVRKFSMVDDRRTNPGVVFVNESVKNKRILTSFYRKVVSELVSIKEAEEVARKVNADVFRMNNGRGIIGALAALGFTAEKKTYELISNRIPKNYGRKRLISHDSVYRMNEKLYPSVFDSIDDETKRILITPRGYDPIFCGIRGKSPEYVTKAWNMVEPLEGIESTIIFETNQGTDEHLRVRKISQIKPYDCLKVEGEVASTPRSIKGGHVVFTLSDRTGSIDCAAYKQTGRFRMEVMKLSQGDIIVVCGGLGKYVSTLNLEKLYVKKLFEVREIDVPCCCGRKMTSAGRNKGYKCRECGKRVRQRYVKSRKKPRELKAGWLEVPPRARRHLSRPLVLA
jgi:tRNA(Ile2)-agmatinylcytidine synthase